MSPAAESVSGRDVIVNGLVSMTTDLRKEGQTGSLLNVCQVETGRRRRRKILTSVKHVKLLSNILSVSLLLY